MIDYSHTNKYIFLYTKYNTHRMHIQETMTVHAVNNIFTSTKIHYIMEFIVFRDKCVRLRCMNMKILPI